MKKSIALFLTVALTLVCTMPVQSSSITDYQNRKNSINSQINSIKSQQSRIQNEIKQQEADAAYLSTLQDKTEDQYHSIVEQKEYLEDLTEKLSIELKNSQENYKTQRDLLKTRLKVMYENSSTSYLQTLIESKSLIEFTEKLQLISNIAENDKRLLDEFSIAKQDLEYKKRAKEEQIKEKIAQAREKQQYISKLSVSRAGIREEIEDNKLTLEDLEKQEDQLNAEANRLNNLIQSLIDKDKKYAGGSMRWPVPSSGLVTSYYGNRFHPILKKYKFHAGIDIGAGHGSSIVAANSGIVRLAGWQNGYGYTVVIDHGGGISTLYAHCSSILVGVGSSVSAGQTIAKVGSTGLSTGPHLHFEVRKNGSTDNPLSHVRR